MKKAMLFFFTLLISNVIFAQKTSTVNETIETKTQLSLTTENQNPQIIIVIESKNYKIDNLQNKDIDPNWIESISVFTDDISKKVFGNKNGVVMIYPKKKYEKRILKMIEIEKDKTATSEKKK